MFETRPNNNSGFLFDIKDGTLYKDHPLFSVNDHALQLIIYYDDVEPANPLGSYRGHHKLGKNILTNATASYYSLQLYRSLLLFPWKY